MTTHADITHLLPYISDTAAMWEIGKDEALDMLVKAGYEALLTAQGITPRTYEPEPQEAEE